MDDFAGFRNTGHARSLVAGAHPTAFEVKEGYGYRASDQFIEAMTVHMTNKVKQAQNN
jgi:hypothetical protein